MRVKMLVDAPGSPDGYTVNEYTGGEAYEVTEALGLVLVSEGLAVADEADAAPVVAPEVVPEGDDAEDVAESKKAAGPSENK